MSVTNGRVADDDPATGMAPLERATSRRTNTPANRRTDRHTNKRWYALPIVAGLTVAMAGCSGGDQADTIETSELPVVGSSAPSTSAAVSTTPASSSPFSSTITTVPNVTTAPRVTTAVPATTPAPTRSTVGDKGGCDGAGAPPTGGDTTAVMVTGIDVDDPDKGANLRVGPSLNDDVDGQLPNGMIARASGQCAESDDGIVWWEISDGHFGGWVSTRHLTTNIPTPTCSTFAGHAGGDRVLADFDGDGQADTLLRDGLEAYVLFADGGVSSRLDLGTVFGGEAVEGQGQPIRFTPANSQQAMVLINLAVTGSATGSGMALVLGTQGCDTKVVLEHDLVNSAANPRRLDVCAGGYLRAVEGIGADGSYKMVDYTYENGSFVAGQPYAKGNAANSDPLPGC